MTTTDDHIAWIEGIKEEHTVIQETMRKIEQELDRLLDAPAKPNESWKLPGLAEMFGVHLRNHFQLEEVGGLLGDVARECDPGTRRTIDKLVEEHRDFERRIDRILNELDEAFVPAATVQACFDDELRGLMSDLAVHEMKETELFQRIVLSETGGGD